MVPQHWLEAAGDHCSTAGQVDELDFELPAIVNDRYVLISEPMAVLAAAVVRSVRFSRNCNTMQRVRFCPFGLLGLEYRFFGDAAVNLCSDIHCAELRITRMHGICTWRGYGIVHFGEGDSDADGGKGKVGGFPPPAFRKA